MKYYEFANDIQIISGNGAINALSCKIELLGSKNIFILSDKVLQKNGNVAKIKALVSANGKMKVSASYCNIDKKSSVQDINEIYEIYRENGCDTILAIGDKYVMDMAKCLRLLIATKTRNILNNRGINCVKAVEKVHFISVFTKVVGDEIANVSYAKDDAKNEIVYFVSEVLKQDLCIADTDFIQVESVGDAVSSTLVVLSNCLESIMSKQANSISINYAKCALELMKKASDCINSDPNNLNQAKEYICNASIMTGIACTNSMTGLAHACANAIFCSLGIEPEKALGAIIVESLKFCADKCKDIFAKMLLYVGGEELFVATPPEKRADVFVETVEKIVNNCREKHKVGLSLSQIGITEDQIGDIAYRAAHDISMLTSAKIATESDIVKLLQLCM